MCSPRKDGALDLIPSTAKIIVHTIFILFEIIVVGINISQEFIWMRVIYMNKYLNLHAHPLTGHSVAHCLWIISCLWAMTCFKSLSFLS